MEFVLLAVFLYLSQRAPNFLTAENLLSVLRTVAPMGLIAFGMTMVIIVGEIDLSVGAMVAFAGCLLAWMTADGVPIPLGIAATLVCGAAVGAFTGLMRAWLQVPSFISTLALFTGLKGAALTITGGFPMTPFPEWFSFLGSGYVLGGIPFPGLVLVAGFVTTHVLMRSTRFGRAIYATGGNPSAARLSGIDVARVRVAVLAITGMLAAWSGVLLASRLMAGSPTAAQGWELDVIAAVIIGGASFTGGVGTAWGTLVGVLFIGVINNGMTLMNVPPYPQYIIRGLLIFVAVLMNKMQARRTPAG